MKNMKSNKKKQYSKLALCFLAGITLSQQGVQIASATEVATISTSAFEIQIDGSIEDWAAVPKVSLNQNHLKEAAMIWKEDFIYLYVLENDYNNGAFTWNTYLELTSNLGRKIAFRSYIADWNQSPKPLQIEGATGASGYCTQVGNAWAYEIKIPSAVLGKEYQEVSLNWINGETILTVEQQKEESTNPPETELPDTDTDTDIDNGNGNETDNGNGESSDSDTPQVPEQGGSVVGGIAIDGSFRDWDKVPHTTLTYQSWNNTSHHDAGLYMDGEYLYVHLKMSDLYGAQLPMNYMVITVNGNQKFSLSMHFQNSQNEVDWSNDSMIYNMPLGTTTGLGAFSDGSYHYLGEAAYTSYNESHSTGDELEFRVSLEAIAKITGIQKESIGMIEMGFPNIGAGSVSISGTSTGAVMGVLISTGIVGSGIYATTSRRKRRKGE